MTAPSSRAFLRVSSRRGEAGSVLFGGIVVAGPIGAQVDLRRFSHAASPEEIELPDGDLCAVVRQEGGSGELRVEYWVERDGAESLRCAGGSREVLVLRRGESILCTTFAGSIPNASVAASQSGPGGA